MDRSGFSLEAVPPAATSPVAIEPFGMTTPIGPTMSSSSLVLNLPTTFPVLVQILSSDANVSSDPTGIIAAPPRRVVGDAVLDMLGVAGSPSDIREVAADRRAFRRTAARVSALEALL